MTPRRYVLLFYTLDPRSGLGKFREYFLKLVDWIKEQPIEKVLQIPEVRERCDRLIFEEQEFKQVLEKHSRSEGNVIITDFRGASKLPTGNRFVIYTLFPKGNISIRLFAGKDKNVTVAALGHSIFNRTSKTDIGALMHKYGGGGHRGAGTCQLSSTEADAKVGELIKQMKADG